MHLARKLASVFRMSANDGNANYGRRSRNRFRGQGEEMRYLQSLQGARTFPAGREHVCILQIAPGFSAGCVYSMWQTLSVQRSDYESEPYTRIFVYELCSQTASFAMHRMQRKQTSASVRTSIPQCTSREAGNSTVQSLQRTLLRA